MSGTRVSAFIEIAIVVSFFASASLIFSQGVPYEPINVLEILAALLAYWLFMFPFVLAAGAFFALPISGALVKMKIRGPISYGVVGLLAGGLVSCGILGGLAIEKSAGVLLWAASIGVLPGMVAGILWWFRIDRFRHQLTQA